MKSEDGMARPGITPAPTAPERQDIGLTPCRGGYGLEDGPLGQGVAGGHFRRRRRLSRTRRRCRQRRLPAPGALPRRRRRETANALTRAADVVLPAASLAEKEGTFTNVQGRVQKFERAFLPKPPVRAHWELLLLLAVALGYGDRNWTPSDLRRADREGGRGLRPRDREGALRRHPAQEGRFRLRRKRQRAMTAIDWHDPRPAGRRSRSADPAGWSCCSSGRAARAASSRTAPGPTAWVPSASSSRPADALKFFCKEDVIPTNADKVLYVLAPALAVFSALTTFAVIPYGATLPTGGRDIPLIGADISIGVLYVFALTSLSVYGDRARRLVLEQQVLAHGRLCARAPRSSPTSSP